jgi:hypothetical protein
MSAFEVMRCASLSVFGAVALACASAPVGALAQALADVGRAGAPISVRIDYVILGPSSGGVQAGGAAPDQDDR